MAASREVVVPTPHDPPRIYRADLTAALDLIAIGDVSGIASVRIEPDMVYVERFAYTDDGRPLTTANGKAATTTTRIEIR